MFILIELAKIAIIIILGIAAEYYLNGGREKRKSSGD
jgi:hypothetical protein